MHTLIIWRHILESTRRGSLEIIKGKVDELARYIVKSPEETHFKALPEYANTWALFVDVFKSILFLPMFGGSSNLEEGYQKKKTK